MVISIKRKNKLRLFLSFFCTFVFCLNIYAQESRYTEESLVKSIISNNTELRKLREEYNQSLLDIKDAKAGLSPTIDLTISGTYMFNPPIKKISINTTDLLSGITMPTGMSPLPQNQYITIFDGMENTLFSFQLNATQPIFTWGKIVQSIKLYTEISKVRQLQVSSKNRMLETELVTRLASLYYLSLIKDKLNIQKQYADKLIQMTKDAETNGIVLHQVVLEAQIQAQQLNITTSSINEQFNTILSGLEKITNINNLSWEKIDYVLPTNCVAKVLSINRETILSTSTNDDRTNIQILNSLITVSNYAKNIANASVYWKPDLALQVSLGYSGSRFPFVETDWFRKDDYSTNLTIAIKTTLWDGGKKLNNIVKSQSFITTSEISKEEAFLSIKQKLQEQFNTLDLSISQIEYQKLKIETCNAKVVQQEQLAKSGYGSERDLVQAKIDLCTAEIELLKYELTQIGCCFTIEYLQKA